MNVEPMDDCVNIIGDGDSEDYVLDLTDDTEFILGRLGFHINCRFLSNTNSDEIRNLRRGRINILYAKSFVTDHQAGIIKEAAGIDCYPEQLPRGLNQTLAWIRSFGKYMSSEEEKIETLCTEIQEQYDSLTKDLVKRLDGCTTIVYTNTSSDLEWLLETFDMLGVKVLEIMCATNSVWNMSESTLKLSKDIPILYDKNTGDLENEISSLKPTFVIGGDYTQHSLKTPHMIFGGTKPGIRGCIEQAKRLVRMVEVINYVDN